MFLWGKSKNGGEARMSGNLGSPLSHVGFGAKGLGSIRLRAT